MDPHASIGTRGTPGTATVRRRLLPLYVAVTLQAMMLWLPVEKLLLNEIGFTASSVGVMAAAYAAVTPLLEVPSGILADRWSRRGVLAVSAVALALCALLGGLSNTVGMYIVSAMVLGVYFAMYSGTVESIVYDLVLEVTGSGDSFPAHIGRVRFLESAALVTSSLAGGWLAGLAGPRLTYFVTIPFAVLAVLAYLRFQEPRLHRAGERTPLHTQVALTYRTIVSRGALLPIIVLGALLALIAQVVFEFGPLWLVALAAPAVVFGPYWAGLMSSQGLGGLLAGRLRLDRPAPVLVLVVLLVAAGVALPLTTSLVAVVVVQVGLALLVAVVAVHVSALLHDGVPSAIRAGVASGVSTLSWIGFLPLALSFGWATSAHGLHTSGWMITAVTVLAGVLLVRASRRRWSRSEEGPASQDAAAELVH